MNARRLWELKLKYFDRTPTFVSASFNIVLRQVTAMNLIARLVIRNWLNSQENRMFEQQTKAGSRIIATHAKCISTEFDNLIGNTISIIWTTWVDISGMLFTVIETSYNYNTIMRWLWENSIGFQLKCDISRRMHVCRSHRRSRVSRKQSSSLIVLNL